MNNFAIAFQAVFPLFIYMFLGYIMRYYNILDEYSLDSMDRVIFKLFFPILIFVNMMEANYENVSNLYYIVFTVCSMFILFFSLIFLIPYLEKDNKKRGVLVLSIMRSNFLIFGLPIIALLCGEKEVSTVATLAVVVIPVTNILGVISLELFRNSNIQWVMIFKRMITNPLIIACIASGALTLFNIKIPNILKHSLTEISRVTTPFALIVLGGGLNFSAIKKTRKQLIIGLLGRLIVTPFAFIFLAIHLDLRGSELVAIMTVFASPCSVSSYTIAKQMGGDADLAGQLVTFSSVISIFTIFCWVFSLRYYSFV